MAFKSILHGVGALALAACAGCEIGSSARIGRSLPVYVEVVAPETSTPALVVPGVVDAHSSRLLAFRYAGRIDCVYVAEGDPVEAGDPIAEFEQVAAEGAVRAAANAVELAELRLAEAARRTGRQRQLIALASDGQPPAAEAGIGSVVQVAELRFARVALANAEAHRAAGVLRAPMAGIVGRLYAAEGDSVTPATPVVRFFDRDSLAVRAAVPLALLPLVRSGGYAAVRLADGAAQALPGTIVSVTAAADLDDGTAPFEVRVAGAASALRPGMVVTVDVEVERRDASFSIPLAAVRRGLDAGAFTFVVVPSGESLRVARRSLVLAGLRGDRATVIAGLEVGDRVVTLGQDLVTVGDAVTIVGEGP